MKQTTINDCKIIDLRKISDPRGNLTPIEGGVDVPFDIKRIYYLYDVLGVRVVGRMLIKSYIS